jgi:hypothetical protein
MTDVIVGQPNGPGKPCDRACHEDRDPGRGGRVGLVVAGIPGVLAPAVAPFMELVLLRNHRGVRNLATFAEAITEHLRTAHPQSVDRDLAEPPGEVDANDQVRPKRQASCQPRQPQDGFALCRSDDVLGLDF